MHIRFVTFNVLLILIIGIIPNKGLINNHHEYVFDYHYEYNLNNITNLLYDDIPSGIKAINTEAFWDLTFGDPNIVVAIIDVGLDYKHPDLIDNIWCNTDEIPLNDIDDDNNGYIDDVNGWDFADMDNEIKPPLNMTDAGHGTHVAGTISAKLNNYGIAGVAPNITIMGLKIFSNVGGDAKEEDLSDAILYAVDNGAKIISMSIGSYEPLGIKPFEYASENDVLMISSSGNDGGSVLYPAKLEQVMAIGAVDNEMKRTTFSNFGSRLDLVAPGVGINSTLPSGSNQYGSLFVDDNEYYVYPMQYSAEMTLNGNFQYVGYGRVSDVELLDLSGKIAIIKRGLITFEEKIRNIVGFGGVGGIIFNNETGSFYGALNNESNIPVVSMSKESGEKLLESINENSTGVLTVNGIPFGLLDGTSMAVPHVSGAASLLYSFDNTLTSEKVKAILQLSATDLGISGKDDLYGYGMLNLKNASIVMKDETSPIIDVGSISLDSSGSVWNIFIDYLAEDNIAVYSVECLCHKDSKIVYDSHINTINGTLLIPVIKLPKNNILEIKLEDLRGNIVVLNTSLPNDLLEIITNYSSSVATISSTTSEISSSSSSSSSSPNQGNQSVHYSTIVSSKSIERNLKMNWGLFMILVFILRLFRYKKKKR